MPDAPDPESLPRFEERCRGDPRAERWFLGQPRPIDLRYVDAAPWEREGMGPQRRAVPRCGCAPTAGCPTTRCCTCAC